MAKRAIYLDERERELARRICDWVGLKARGRLGHYTGYDVETPALNWLNDETTALRAKFEEPNGEGEQG